MELKGSIIIVRVLQFLFYLSGEVLSYKTKTAIDAKVVMQEKISKPGVSGEEEKMPTLTSASLRERRVRKESIYGERIKLEHGSFAHWYLMPMDVYEQNALSYVAIL